MMTAQPMHPPYPGGVLLKLKPMVAAAVTHYGRGGQRGGDEQEAEERHACGAAGGTARHGPERVDGEHAMAGGAQLQSGWSGVGRRSGGARARPARAPRARNLSRQPTAGEMSTDRPRVRPGRPQHAVHRGVGGWRQAVATAGADDSDGRTEPRRASTGPPTAVGLHWPKAPRDSVGGGEHLLSNL